MRSKTLKTFCSVLACGVALSVASSAPASDPSELSRFLVKTGAKQNVVKPAQGLLKFPYLVPSGPYSQLFDWDMYFMGVALSYDGVGVAVADSVKDFLNLENVNANERGYTPREIAPDGLWALPEQCKPFMAQAAVRASITMGTFDWTKGSYEQLKTMMTFWETSRQAKDGLFLWYDGTESGVDNNPAVSSSPTQVTEGVDLQTYLIREYQALSIIAGHLGVLDESKLFDQKATRLQKLMLEKMWSPTDHLFYNIDSRTGQQIQIKTWTSFVPLWAHLATNDQAKSMIETHLLSKDEFWADHGVRTIARTEPLYAPDDGYWQGPVWVISNYLVMHGLLNYGYQDRAVELAQKTVDLLIKDFASTGGMNECYNPETGAPTAGGNFVSWNLLAEHILQEAQTGYDPTSLSN